MKIRQLLFYTIFVWALLELVLYILGLPKDYKPHTMPNQFWKSSDPAQTLYVNTKSTSIDFVYDGNPRGYFHYDNTVQHVTNSSGYRGPEISVNKATGTDRLLFLGDSFTFGEGVYFEDTFPEQFKKQALAAGLFSTNNIEPINLGVGGYNTSQEYQTLALAAKDGLDPDQVVVQYGMNDADGQFIWSADGTIRRPSDLDAFVQSKYNTPFIFRASRILRIVRNWYVGGQVTAKTIAYYHGLYQDSSPSWAATKQAIQQFGDFQKTTGKPVVFVIYPVLFNLDNYPFASEEKLVETELQKNNLPYVVLRDDLKGYKGPELWVHPTDQHPNEIVHRVAAQALVGYFQNLQTK